MKLGEAGITHTPTVQETWQFVKPALLVSTSFSRQCPDHGYGNNGRRRILRRC